ncbi:MAG: ABC transporter ATP-binding protein [Verrucomicrobia bacterium]|nr:ABC transporter ATP-binding protein [Verrucomicrobiota bacterium]
MGNGPLLQVRDLCVSLKVGRQVAPVVDRLSFHLRKGETLALVGESGCGKSMTALALLGILPKPPALPPTGEVLFRGKNLLTLPEKEMRKLRGSRISMIFQDPHGSLNPVYPIGDQLLEVVSLHLRLKGVAAQEKVVQMLEEVGISEPHQRMKEYPHQLSGGLKQRVMIAMSLLCEPDILIADEPTTALDVTVQAQVLHLMQELQSKRGMAILLITHDMGVVAQMADEVMVMYASWAVEQGAVRTIFDAQAHPYTRGLFNSRPGQNKKLQAIEGVVPPPTKWPSGCRFHPRCQSAMERCKEGEVPYFSLSSEHQVRCHLYDSAREENAPG